MTVANRARIAGRRYPARPQRQTPASGLIPIQPAQCGIGEVTLDPAASRAAFLPPGVFSQLTSIGASPCRQLRSN